MRQKKSITSIIKVSCALIVSVIMLSCTTNAQASELAQITNTIVQKTNIIQEAEEGRLFNISGELEKALGNIKKTTWNMKDNKYSQVFDFESGERVYVIYIIDIKAVTVIEEIRIYKNRENAIIYFKQPKIEAGEYFDKVMFKHKSSIYVLYGQLLDYKRIAKKSYFLLRRYYAKDERTAYIFNEFINENTINVKKTTTEDVMLDIPIIYENDRQIIQIDQDIIPEFTFKVEVRNDENLDPIYEEGKSINCKLILPEALKQILFQNDSNRELLG